MMLLASYQHFTVEPRYAVTVKWKRYSLMMIVEISKGDVEHTQPSFVDLIDTLCVIIIHKPHTVW